MKDDLNLFVSITAFSIVCLSVSLQCTNVAYFQTLFLLCTTVVFFFCQYS